MKTLHKLTLAAALCVASAPALEFSELGHKSLSMGSTGVALKNNPYAIFYNPALSAASPATRLGYGLNGSFAEKNILQVFNYDLSNVQLQDLETFNELLKDNFVNIKLSGAVAFKLPDILPYGQLSVGFAQSVYGVANFTGKLEKPGSIGVANFTGKLEKPGSIQDAIDIVTGEKKPVTLNMRRVDIMEIPVSYAISNETPIGQVSVGAAVKFMNASSKLTNEPLSVNHKKDDILNKVQDTLKGSGATSASNVGLDLGVVYSPMDLGLSVGLSAKNLNTPKFKFGENGELKIKPQARLGAAWELGEIVSIAGDIDLTNNELISASKEAKKQTSQKIGIGAAVDMMFFGARAGVAKDLRQDNGAILSLGLGFGFLDIGAAVATKTSKVENTSYPRYFAITVGGGFSF